MSCIVFVRVSSATKVEANDGSFFNMLTEIKKEFKSTELEPDAGAIVRYFIELLCLLCHASFFLYL